MRADDEVLFDQHAGVVVQSPSVEVLLPSQFNDQQLEKALALPEADRALVAAEVLASIEDPAEEYSLKQRMRSLGTWSAGLNALLPASRPGSDSARHSDSSTRNSLGSDRAVPFEPEALADIASAARFLRPRAPRAGLEFGNAVNARDLAIPRFPNAGRLVEHVALILRARHVRLRQFPYLVIYVVVDATSESFPISREAAAGLLAQPGRLPVDRSTATGVRS